MTLQQYIHLNGSNLTPKGQVVLQPEECTIYGDWIYLTPMLSVRPVQVHMFDHTYTQKSTGNLLWTSDHHGNPKSPSVFSLPHNHKHNLDVKHG